MAHSPAVADRWYDMGQGIFKSSKAQDIILNPIWSLVLTKTAVKVATTEEEWVDGDVDDPSDIDQDEDAHVFWYRGRP